MPDEQLAPAEVAEREAEHRRQPDVAEPHPARVDPPQQPKNTQAGDQPAQRRRGPGPSVSRVATQRDDQPDDGDQVARRDQPGGQQPGAQSITESATPTRHQWQQVQQRPGPARPRRRSPRRRPRATAPPARSARVGRRCRRRAPWAPRPGGARSRRPRLRLGLGLRLGQPAPISRGTPRPAAPASTAEIPAAARRRRSRSHPHGPRPPGQPGQQRASRRAAPGVR